MIPFFYVFLLTLSQCMFDDILVINLLWNDRSTSNCSNSFNYLRKVWSLRGQFKTSVLIELIKVLMLSRVDNCNSLYYGLPRFLLAKLQRIMNSAARLIFRLSPTPTSSYLKQLHCLPIRQRIVFKILLSAHRFIHQPGKLHYILRN